MLTELVYVHIYQILRGRDEGFRQGVFAPLPPGCLSDLRGKGLREGQVLQLQWPQKNILAPLHWEDLAKDLLAGGTVAY